MALKKAFKKKWIEALRSGKYNQSELALRTNRGFCCLGVACDIIDPKGWIAPEIESSVFRWKTGRFKEKSAFVPTGVAKKIGLTDMSKLTDLNDHDQASFDEIADYIEKEL